MEKNKVVAIFTNDKGEYYLEAIETLRPLEELHEDWSIEKVIDETENWRSYELTREELSNPTTFNNEQLAVIQFLNEHIK